MAALPPEFERSAKKLIKHLTGFREKDENFHICLNFVLSNFKYHRFLEVDSHKVRRNIDGMHEKFQIYSQHKKADEYQHLVQDFLSTPAFNENKPNTDTHFALLLILLNLADTPTKADYIPSVKKKQADEVEEFDWKAYLLEGEDTTRPIYPESSDDEEWVLDDDNNDAVTAATLPSDSGVQIDANDTSGDYLDERRLKSLEFQSSRSHHDWLKQNVVVRYWADENTTSFNDEISGISDIWEKYLFDANPLYIAEKRHLVTETQIIRETLWMLFGTTNSGLFVYDYTERSDRGCGFYSVSERLKMVHLTSRTLINVLESFCYHGNIVNKLETFVATTTELSASPSATGTCQTYQAFAKAIGIYLKGFKNELVDLEAETMKQDGTITIATIQNRLSSSFKQLTLIGQIYDDCLSCRQGDMRFEANRLITRLYSVLMTVKLYNNENTKKFKLLFPIWLYTIRPYLNIISDWLTSGRLNDIYNEFVISRNEEIKNDDADFWQKSFVLHCDDPEQVDDEYYPQFLQPILRELLLCGKSMEVLKSLGKLQKVIPKKEHRFPLYQKFIDNLQKLTSPEKPSNDNNTTASGKCNLGNKSIVTQSDNQYDALLGINFADIFSGENFFVDDYNNRERQLQIEINNLSIHESSPIYRLINQCLYPFIRERYRLISQQFLSILKHEYSLEPYLSAMKSFYLMEAGDTMYDFCTVLFEKLRHLEDWKDPALLNSLLEDAIDQHFTEHKSSISIEVEDVAMTTKAEQPINALNCLKLHYKLPWAISLVVNTNAEEIYQQIFSQLLQIKRAKYSLDSLHHSDLLRNAATEKQSVDETFLSIYITEDAYFISVRHRMLLLRQKLLHFINSFHNYIMTRILHSSGLEFDSELQKCNDFDQVIEAHSRYTSKLQEQCLLTKPLAVLKEAVNRVFNLALKFSTMWSNGSTSMNDLSDIETDLSRCINFLSVFLNNIIKRGSTPHLETLAFYLSTAENQKT